MLPHHSKVGLTHLLCDGDERLHSPNPASSKPFFVYILSIWLMADPLKPHQGAPHHRKVHLTYLFCDGDERLHSPNPASSKPFFVYILSIWLMAQASPRSSGLF